MPWLRGWPPLIPIYQLFQPYKARSTPQYSFNRPHNNPIITKSPHNEFSPRTLLISPVLQVLKILYTWIDILPDQRKILVGKQLVSLFSRFAACTSFRERIIDLFKLNTTIIQLSFLVLIGLYPIHLAFPGSNLLGGAGVSGDQGLYVLA